MSEISPSPSKKVVRRKTKYFTLKPNQKLPKDDPDQIQLVELEEALANVFNRSNEIFANVDSNESKAAQEAFGYILHYY